MKGQGMNPSLRIQEQTGHQEFKIKKLTHHQEFKNEPVIMKDQGTNPFMILVIAYKRTECNWDKERTRCQEFKNERISTVILHKITVHNCYGELRSKYYFVPISRKSVYP